MFRWSQHWLVLHTQTDTLSPTQVRLNLLSTLLDEAYGFLHRFMCASALGRKVFTLPFSRDVDITFEGARAMRACLQYCQQVIGRREIHG